MAENDWSDLDLTEYGGFIDEDDAGGDDRDLKAENEKLREVCRDYHQLIEMAIDKIYAVKNFISELRKRQNEITNKFNFKKKK
jgi:hypothetical protein